MKNLLIVGVPTLVSLVAVFWIYFKILKIAKVKNIVDNPDARKLQKTPVPVLGGIAVFFGVICAFLSASCLQDMSSVVPVLAAMGLMIYIGAMDDIVGLSPMSRLVIEMLTLLGLIYGSNACVDSFHGLWGIESFSWYYAVPLTVVAGVGIINAMNMIDGVNGLSSGLCITCCLLFGSAFSETGDWADATLAYTMAAALFPFLLHNVFGKSSRMFIGDAGTMTMGVLMSWFVLQLLRSDSASNVTITVGAHHIDPIALALAILSVPVFDTLRVMTNRAIHGRSPFSADKTHLHHAFIKQGVSHSVTSACEILIDLAVVGVLMLAHWLGASQEVQLYAVVAAAIVLVWGSYALLWFNDKHETIFISKVRKMALRTHLGHTNWWLGFQGWLDAPEFELDSKEHQVRLFHRHSRKYLNEDPKGKKIGQEK